MVFGRAWRFIKRHRGKLALGGALAGGAYLLHWWLQGQRTRHGGGDDEVTALLSELERAQFLRSTGQNCAATVAALLPGLAAQLDADLGVEQVTAELRTKPSPERRAELCDRLRARAFARLLAGVYAVCGSVLCAHVQLHLLAGLLYQQKRAASSVAAGSTGAAADDSDDGDSPDGRWHLELSEEVKIRFLGLLDTRAHLSKLASELESHCLAESPGSDMRDRVSLRRLDSLLHRLRLGFEAKAAAAAGSVNGDSASLQRLLLPSLSDSLSGGVGGRQLKRGPFGNSPAADGDVGAEARRQLAPLDQSLLLQRLCSEADARLRSADGGRVLKRLLDSAGLALLRVFTAHYQGLDTEASLHERTLPLLKVLPLLNSTVSLLLSRQFLDASGLADCPDLMAFSAGLFDSLGGEAGSGREMS